MIITKNKNALIMLLSIIEKVKNIQKCFKCSNGLMTIMSASDKLVDVTIFLNNRFTSASMPAY
jgi:hypothetical protein